MKLNFKHLNFLFIFLLLQNAYSKCPSFIEMVRRIDGMEHGTPLTMHSNNGEIIQGTFNGMYRDPGSNISYITIKGKNGIITYHPLSTVNPGTFNAPIDNLYDGSTVYFRSKSGRNEYRGQILSRTEINGEDVFVFRNEHGVTGHVRVSRVNENSIRVLDMPVEKIHLPRNNFRTQSSDLASGDFVSLEFYNPRVPTESVRYPARVKSLRTGVDGDEVYLEVITPGGKIETHIARGDQLKTLRHSSTSYRNFDELGLIGNYRMPDNLPSLARGNKLSANTGRTVRGNLPDDVGNPSGLLNNHIDFTQIAKAEGRILDNSFAVPSNLEPGARYTYILKKDGSFVFGKVDNSWEVGVKHLNLAGEDAVVAAGEIMKKNDGTFIFNTESGSYTKHILKQPGVPAGYESQMANMVESALNGKAQGKIKISYTKNSILKGLPPPTVRDLARYCRNQSFNYFNSIFLRPVGGKGFSRPTNWCRPNVSSLGNVNEFVEAATRKSWQREQVRRGHSLGGNQERAYELIGGKQAYNTDFGLVSKEYSYMTKESAYKKVTAWKKAQEAGEGPKIIDYRLIPSQRDPNKFQLEIVMENVTDISSRSKKIQAVRRGDDTYELGNDINKLDIGDSEKLALMHKSIRDGLSIQLRHPDGHPLNYFTRIVKKKGKYDIETVAIDLDNPLLNKNDVRKVLAKGPEKNPSQMNEYDFWFSKEPRTVYVGQYNFYWNLKRMCKSFALPPSKCFDVITPESVF